METPVWKNTAHIEFQNLMAFKSAVAASLSLTATRLLGYIDGGLTDLPSFSIQVDGVAKQAYVSGVAESGQIIESVIIYCFGATSDENDDQCLYALAWPIGDGDEWSFGPNIAIDDVGVHPQFTELAISEQLKQLEAA